MTLQFKIPPAKAKKVLEEAISLSKEVWVEQLDCSHSFLRQKTEKTVQEVLDIGLNDKTTHYIFIYRPKFTEQSPDYFEIGLSTMLCRGIDYFLFIKLDFETGWGLAKKHKLERLTW